MTGEVVQFSLQQLLTQLPVLLAYVIGMVLALIFLRRCTGASVLTLVGAGVSIAVLVIQTFLVQYLILNRLELGTDMRGFNQMMVAINVAANIFRALAIGLFLAAIFVGRKKNVPSLS
jgi:hypothetical protein